MKNPEAKEYQNASRKRYRAITLSGEVGSGKSALASALLSLLPDWQRTNIGQLFRQFCRERGLSIQEIGQLGDEVHNTFDATQRRLLETAHNAIVEGRLAGWLSRDLSDVFRVYCYAPIEVRMQRYAQRDGASLEQARIDILTRDEHDLRKYEHLYGVVDYRLPDYYHLALDTSSADPPTLARKILQQAGLNAST